MNIAIKACDHCGDDHIMQEIHLCWNKEHTSISSVCERCMKKEGLEEAK
jgi:hypothetical protein